MLTMKEKPNLRKKVKFLASSSTCRYHHVFGFLQVNSTLLDFQTGVSNFFTCLNYTKYYLPRKN